MGSGINRVLQRYDHLELGSGGGDHSHAHFLVHIPKALEEVIVYKDMTFCPFYKDCQKQHQCHRPLTPEVRESAHTWWKRFTSDGDEDSAPISQYSSKPTCHTQILKMP